MSTADNNEPGTEGMVQISQAELDQLRADSRKAAAIQAGFDMDNPVTDLVLDKHYTPGISADDLKGFGEQYNILGGTDDSDEGTVPPAPEGVVEEVTGGQEAGTIQSTLSGGTNINSNVVTPDPEHAAAEAYKGVIGKGGNREDAMAAALHANLSTSGQKHVLDRIRKRNDDEQRAQAIIASHQAAGGVGS